MSGSPAGCSCQPLSVRASRTSRFSPSLAKSALAVYRTAAPVPADAYAPGRRADELSIRSPSQVWLADLALDIDGRRCDAMRLEGTEPNRKVKIDRPSEARWVFSKACDLEDMESTPQARVPGSRLFSVSVETDS